MNFSQPLLPNQLRSTVQFSLGAEQGDLYQMALLQLGEVRGLLFLPVSQTEHILTTLSPSAALHSQPFAVGSE